MPEWTNPHLMECHKGYGMLHGVDLWYCDRCWLVRFWYPVSTGCSCWPREFFKSWPKNCITWASFWLSTILRTFFQKETRSTKFHGKFPGEDSKLLQNQEFLENWLQFLGVVSNGFFCKNLMIPFPNLMNHQIVRPFLAILLPIPDWWSLLGLSSHCDGDLVLWCFVKLRTQKTRLNKKML